LNSEVPADEEASVFIPWLLGLFFLQ